MNTPIVIKADGLASGKGVSICNNKNEALQKCKEINQGKFKIEIIIIIIKLNWIKKVGKTLDKLVKCLKIWNSFKW